MTINDILKDLKLIEDTFRVKIITTNYSKLSDNEVSWVNYKSGIFRNIYAKEYESIIRNRQYSFLLADDKGCVQFYYFFNGRIIEKVKMAYYPYPVELNETRNDYENMLSDSNDEVLEEYYYDLWNIFNHNFELDIKDDELKKLVLDSVAYGNNESVENLLLAKLEYKYKVTNTSHLRIDYDLKVKSHHKCEIQIGAINNIRLPMSKLISPFLFFEFIFKNIFKKEYATIIGKSAYKTQMSIVKKNSFEIKPFVESNIFIHHK
jgi:hypothetical protein